jgi:FlaA1/EpsC-like NDP-sugar epimerase
MKLGKRFAHKFGTVRADLSLAIIESGLIAVAYAAALSIRSLDPSGLDPVWWGRLALALPIIVLTHVGANILFGNYGHVWSYASVDEAVRVAGAAMTSGFVLIGIAGIYQLFSESAIVPLSVFVIGALLTLGGMGALRFWSRMFSKQRIDEIAAHQQQRALIVGVESDAVHFARHRSPSTAGVGVVGFVDIAPVVNMSRTLAGYPILGGVEDVPRLVKELDIDQVVIACPDADEYGRRLVDLCMDVDVRLRILPAIDTIMQKGSATRDVRDLELTDLLPRQPVSTDLSGVGAFLEGRRVLVTGAGGSIGSEIVKQALKFGTSTVIAVDHDETHLHDAAVIWNSVAGTEGRVLIELADIRDHDRVTAIFDEFEPEVVFHAAAHKHVPILERCPAEAVKTNIVGTLNVVEASSKCDATDSFVLISTDKAVEPKSVMGATKRIAEMIIQGKADGATDMKWSAVRFGNVLGSRGSVVPTFKRQVQDGGPVTVSHPDMERYFMTVAEAVELVLQAASISQGGEVFVLDMGSPVRILDLAHRIIRLAGLVPYEDIDVVITGLRPGERLTEQLAVVPLLPSAHEKVLIARHDVPDQKVLNESIDIVRVLADTEHAKLGDLVVAIANEAWQQADLVDLEFDDIRIFRSASNG